MTTSMEDEGKYVFEVFAAKRHHPGTGKVRNYMDTKQVAVSPFLRATRRKSLGADDWAKPGSVKRSKAKISD
ncbi:hypothetical protein OIU78_013563 [Salix suchowensis]|nr:hypothetical protein OIU78_013563 [Salix suchowensis]